MKWPDEEPVRLPPLPRKIMASQLLTGGTMQFDQTDAGLLINIPPRDARM